MEATKAKPKKRKQELTLNAMMRIIDGAYPDGFTANYWNPRTQEVRDEARGDTLAEFIVREVTECCRDMTGREMLAEALRSMERAREEMEDVCAALSDELARVEARSARKGK